MSSEPVKKIEYHIRDLGTRSVTLFPTRAQIHRDIKNIPLEPGINEIIISGLSPTVDENSIKVEGNGIGIINDIAVEALPNTKAFKDVYPDSDDDLDDDDESDSDSDAIDRDSEVVAVTEKLQNLQEQLGHAQEEQLNAMSRVKILDSYSKTLHNKQKVAIADHLHNYKVERQAAYEDQKRSTEAQTALQKQITDAQREVTKVTARRTKALVKAGRQKAKEREAKERKRQERIKEKERIREERLAFWPKYCYTARITLDCSAYTPQASRRGSIASDIDLIKSTTPTIDSYAPTATDGKDEAVSSTCDLVLSYITSSASWAPSYDLQLSTTKATGTLCFDAKVTNKTSETWKNCRVTLSTSEATFGGLEDAIPKLIPWHIRLVNKHYGNQTDNITFSVEEQNKKNDYKNKRTHGGGQVHKPRHEMFGLTEADIQREMRLLTDEAAYAGNGGDYAAQPGPYVPPGMSASVRADYEAQLRSLEMQNKRGFMMAKKKMSSLALQPQQQQQQQQQMQIQQQIQSVMPQMRSSSSAKPPPPAAMAASAPAPPPAPSGGGGMGFGSILPAVLQRGEKMDSLPRAAFGRGGDDGSDSDEDEDESGLGWQDSLVEETGLTTTYDLPGIKTLEPRNVATKQRVARVSFTSVAYSHTIVPKYRPEAFLKAKMKNSSKLTLLSGDAGLTLDGSFIGRTKLPRCSAGDAFSLSLGVDPAIKVVYPKPDIRRATSGVFTKESNLVYLRRITLHNTRAAAGRAVQLTVLDQVPVSQDERLNVSVVTPGQLVASGSGSAAGVSTGLPGRSEGEDRDWGKALAKMTSEGEVKWEVQLKAGKAVQLRLEYMVSKPTTGIAEQC